MDSSVDWGSVVNLCAEHSMPFCRECNRTKKAPFGSVRKPLKKSKPKRQKMSADAKVQDAMLGRGRCYVADGMQTDCTDGYSQRSHIVGQQLIARVFEHGAYNLHDGDGWFPFEPDGGIIDWECVVPERRTLQEILDDNRNIVPTCPNHNVDGIDMVKALGVVGTPDGFDDFLAEYGFAFNGRHWVYEPERRAVA